MKAKQLKEYDPALTAMARIQNQLDALLSDLTLEKVPAEERLKLVQNLQNRFSEIKHQADLPIQLAGISKSIPEPAAAPHATPPLVAPAAPAVATTDKPTNILGVNKRYPTHAHELMKLISSNPNVISVNDRMEIVVNGLRVPGSNIHDLVSDAFTSAKTRITGPRPEGFGSFLDALKDINAPHSLFVNPLYSQTAPPSPLKHMNPSVKLHRFQISSASRRASLTPKYLSLYKL